MFEKTYRIEHDRILDRGFEVRVHFRGIPGWREVPDYSAFLLRGCNHFETIPEARKFIDKCIAGKNVQKQDRVVEYYPSRTENRISEIDSYPAAWHALTTALQIVPAERLRLVITSFLETHKPSKEVYDFLNDMLRSC